MSGLRAQIKEVLKENSSDNMNLGTDEIEFWKHLKAHSKAHNRGNHKKAQNHLKIAQLLAAQHYNDTETKIDGRKSSKYGIDGDVINQFNSRYVELG
jgi:hypothetical protein